MGAPVSHREQPRTVMSYAEVLICSSSSNRSGACKTGRSVRSSEEAEEQDERLGHGRGDGKGKGTHQGR